jgi:phosphonatase-like hydrolase
MTISDGTFIVDAAGLDDEQREPERPELDQDESDADESDEWDAEFEELDVELVVLDMAGTTVRDDGLVERAFVVAARAVGLATTDDALEAALDYVRETMGQSKIQVFRALTESEDAANAANLAFEAAYLDLVAEAGVTGIEGAEELFRELRDYGVKIALTTGFSRATQNALLDALGWADLIDLTLCPEDAGRGRPFPDLNLTALLRAGATSVSGMVVVGDTASDMLAGVNAGAGLVVGVLSGTHDEETLEDAGADVIIDSIADLAELLGLREGDR